MAKSKCSHCNNMSFEVVESAPIGSSYKINIVQCAMCGAVVGAMDYWATGSLVKEQEAVLKNHTVFLQDISNKVDQIGVILNQMNQRA